MLLLMDENGTQIHLMYLAIFYQVHQENLRPI